MIKIRPIAILILLLLIITLESSWGDQKFYVAKLDKNGDVEWEFFPPSSDYWDRQLLLCADDEVYLAGEKSIMRISENGDMEWLADYNGQFGNLTCDEDGGIILLSSTIGPTKVATIQRFTASGDLTINIDYQASQQCDFRGEFYRINETTNAMIWKMNEQSCADELIVLDSEMNEKWRLEGNNSDADWITLIRVVPAVDGSFFLLSEGEDGAKIQKFSENGGIFWSLLLPFNNLYPTKTVVDTAEWYSVLAELTTSRFFIGGIDEAELLNSGEPIPIRIQEYSLEGLLLRQGDLITDHSWLNLVDMTVGWEMDINILAEGGYFSDSEMPITNIMASKMNVDGNMQWIYEYDCGDQLVDVPYYLQNDSQGSIYFNGIVCRENDEPNFDDDTADDNTEEDNDADQGCGC
ncbi:MAG: hypothetical protein GX444_03460 [Myxococcales bacterium]|nr:hypothetical protein [Myxococcales bacterium]